MADVTVEFGAQDVGLEKTLKTIQAEMADLQSKVTSGDLTMSELEKTMRRIGQVESMEKRLKAMGSESSDAGIKVNKLGSEIIDTGNKSDKGGGLISASFAKIAGGVAVGELAVKSFSAVLDAAFSAARGVVEGFKAALDLGGALSDLSVQTGETAGNLLLLQTAFENNGLSAEQVGPVLGKLEAAIHNTDEESKKAALGFGRMGISLSELDGKTPTEQLDIVSSGLQSIKDPGERAAAAIAVFGKSGASLVPLLSDFNGAMTDAATTVGSMADIMDRRAAVFDAISDRFTIIGNKVRDFAAGILDKALPAIDAITSALSRIDASAIGQKLADAFLGGQDAMRGFQASVDAISIGKAGLAFEVFWESLKLQAMQTADQAARFLVAGFQTAGDLILNIFRSDGPTLLAISSGFEYVAQSAKASISGALADIASSLGPAFSGIEKGLRQNMEAGATAAELALQRIPVAAELAAEDISKSLGASGDAMIANFEKVPPIISGIADQQEKVATLEGEVADAVKSTADEREKANTKSKEELDLRAQIRAETEAAAVAEKQAKVDLIKLETDINKAKADGNQELVKSLEAQKKELQNNAEIKKLAEEYQKTLGVNASEAERLATNFVDAKNAAANTATATSNISSGATAAGNNLQTVKDVLDDIAKTKADAPLKSLQERTDEAKKALASMKDFIGEDISKMDLESITRKLGIDSPGLSSSKDRLKDIEDAIADLNKADPKDITPKIDKIGVNDKLEAIKAYLANLKGKDIPITATADIQPAEQAIASIKGNNVTSTVNADTSPAQQSIADLGQPTTTSVSADTTQAQQSIADLGKPVATTLNADASIALIKKDFKDGIDTAINGSAGSKILETIRTYVETIKDLVTKIEPRLPVAALTA